MATHGPWLHMATHGHTWPHMATRVKPVCLGFTHGYTWLHTPIWDHQLHGVWFPVSGRMGGINVWHIIPICFSNKPFHTYFNLIILQAFIFDQVSDVIICNVFFAVCRSITQLQLQLQLPLHYTTLHYTTLHHTTLHYTTVITLHYTTTTTTTATTTTTRTTLH